MKVSMMSHERSLNKQKFFEEKGDDRLPYQLAAKDLPSLVRHYAKKGINIIINGTSTWGQEKIGGKQKQLQPEIDLLESDVTKLAAHFIRCWIPQDVPKNDYDISCNDYAENNRFERDEIKELSALLPKFLIEQHLWLKRRPLKLKDEYSEADLKEMNLILSKASCHSKLEEGAILYLASRREAQADLALSQDEVVTEMQEIKASLKPGEVCGYIYTGGQARAAGHFEAFLISDKEIIKPVLFNYRLCPMIRAGYDSSPNLSPLVKNPGVYGGVPDCPQAGTKECGTLAVLYLKELLKNSEQQLKEFSLSFQYYLKDDQGEIREHSFFLPSPQVLRYSQVSMYNEVMAALLREDKSVVEITKTSIEDKQIKWSITTLKTILQVSIELAKEKGNSVLAEQNQKILAKLPLFSKHWLEAYQIADHQRKVMYDGKGYNHYLIYRTRKMEGLAKAAHREEQKHGEKTGLKPK